MTRAHGSEVVANSHVGNENTVYFSILAIFCEQFSVSLLTCDQASLCFRGGKVRLTQLLDYLSVASPESGLFSDWSRNKRYT